MKLINFLLLIILCSFGTYDVNAIPPTGSEGKKTPPKVDLRNDCLIGTNSIELDINNVRARLISSGDIWWDRSRAQYIVPKPSDPSIPGVASIFAGGVWLGGRDGAGNLKVAVSTFPNQSRTDYFPGPLTPNGTTDRETCRLWDRFWTVYLDDIIIFRQAWLKADEEGRTLPLDSVPESLLRWPGFQNPFFQEYNGFSLPQTDQPLAGFYDHDEDGIYNPLNGDLPAIEIRGCPISPDQIPDMMIFWIYNDAGNVHTESDGLAMQMEVQAQAFAYQTSDEVNDMTFIRYKLLNRAAAPISSTYFAMWVDPDLGCSDDDYVGCDTTRSLAIVYNSKAIDGTPGAGCTCGPIPTYCTEIPILGIDYFRGPLADTSYIDDEGNFVFEEFELGMSSFTYYNREDPNNEKRDPRTVVQYYNYLTGRWRDGTPFTEGGDGYDPDGKRIRYAFPGQANDINGWSMCSEGLAPVDLRTLQASGPFVLNVGRINELIVGLPWVPNQNYPCPSFNEIYAADDKAQALFDNCFNIIDGPDAPDLSVIELDREVVFTISNAAFPTSNNENETYQEVDTYAPTFLPEEDRMYRFQGYKIYQLASSEVGRSELNNPERARLVLQMDVKDTIAKIYNWVGIPGTTPSETFIVPQLMVDGKNEGIRRTFSIRNDVFAREDVRMVNHKKYYFMAIAYAHNEFSRYNPNNDTIYQPNVYLEGRRNIQTYTVTPRQIINLDLNASYGDGVIITRLDGRGNPGVSLRLDDASRKAVEDFGNFDGSITYEEGTGPLKVSIYNPIDIKDGNYSLKLLDNNLNDQVLSPSGNWELRNIDNDEVIFSEKTLAEANEQLIPEYGFSIDVTIGNNVGDKTVSDMGVVGSNIFYEDDITQQWLRPIQNANFRLTGSTLPGGFQQNIFTYLRVNGSEADLEFDPRQNFRRIADVHGVSPFLLTNFRPPTGGQTFYFTPAGAPNIAQLARANFDFVGGLNNVDIVMTSDKSLWSRCIVVETSHRDIQGNLLPSGSNETFSIKSNPSLSREVDGNGNPVEESTTGFSWFPGYAVDAETGQRLNIFFGESSLYRPNGPIPVSSYSSGKATGNDMIWNPTPDELLLTDANLSLVDFVLGGHHHIYVTNTAYDECARLATDLRGNLLARTRAYRSVSWSGMFMLNQGFDLLSYKDGLIPNKARISVRVNKPYGVSAGSAKIETGHPEYFFKIENKEALSKIGESLESALDLINVVPNPYYANSEYEVNSNINVVKITNLPYESDVTIFTLNGDFVRKFQRNVAPVAARRANEGVLFRQPLTNIEWDMNNSQGIPVASGIYLIHVKTPNDGERVIKWLCVNRPFDSSTF
jgi:hypothetical protein